jgi:hypothetical protein
MSFPIGPNAPQLHNMGLDRNFGDSPVGRLGGSAVQAAQAGAPRSGPMSHTAVVIPGMGLGSRILNAVTPQGLRTESKVLAGLHATSAQVGDLLGALSKASGHSVDGLTAKKLLGSLPQTAAPLTRRGADFGEVFSQRVSVHVQNMSTAQLVALRDGVEMATSSALAADSGTELAVVKSAVGRELTQRLLDTATQKMEPILAKLVAELPREAANPGAVTFAFDELGGAAFQLLTEHGESFAHQKSASDFDHLKLALIKQTLSTAVDNDTITLPHIGAILGHLSSKDLRALDMRTEVIGTDVPFSMERLVSGAIGLRAQQTETAFVKAADALLARTLPASEDANGSLHNPQGFAKDIIAAARNLTQLREHGEINHLHFSEAVGDKSAQLLTHLERLCSPGNLLVEELSHSQLHAFSEALLGLGVERGAAHIAAELKSRKDDASDGFGKAILATFTAAQSHDAQALLSSLKAFADASSSSVQTLQRLGAPIGGADKVMAFREAQSTQALETLTTEQLGSLFSALNSPELKSLKESLGDMGQTLLENENTVVGRQLYNASLDLASTASLVRDVLVSRGLKLPDLPDEASYGTATLSPDGHTAILAEFGVQAGTGGTVIVKTGVAGADFQSAFDDNVKAMADKPTAQQLTMANHLDGTPTGVSEALWLDLARANYAVVGADGSPRSILSKTGAEGATEAEKMAAVAQLRSLVNGNEALLMKVSEFANQNTLSGFINGMMADTPLRMGDGSSGQPVSPKTGTTSFTLASDGAGGVVMNINYALRDIQSLLKMDGTQTALAPAQSQFELSAKVSISQDLQVQTSAPVRFSQQLQADFLPDASDIERMPPQEIAALRKTIGDLENKMTNQLKQAIETGNEAEKISIMNQQYIYTDRLGECREAIVSAVKDLDAQSFLNTLGTDVSFIMTLPPNSPVRVALREHLQNEFALENLNFLEAVASGQHQNIEGALRLYNNMVSDAADEQINVSSKTRVNLRDALAQPGANTLTGKQFDDLFNDAFNTIASAVSSDNVSRLMGKLKVANQAAIPAPATEISVATKRTPGQPVAARPATAVPQAQISKSTTLSNMQDTLREALLAGVPRADLLGNIAIALSEGRIDGEGHRRLENQIALALTNPEAAPATSAPAASANAPTLDAKYQPLTNVQFMYQDEHVNALASIYQAQTRSTAPDVVFVAPVSNLESASLVEIFKGATLNEWFGTNFKMAIPIHSGSQNAGHWTGAFVSVNTDSKSVYIQGVDSLAGERTMPQAISNALRTLFSDQDFFPDFTLSFGTAKPAYLQGSTLSCGPCTMENLLAMATTAAPPSNAQATDMAALRLRQAALMQAAV